MEHKHFIKWTLIVSVIIYILLGLGEYLINGSVYWEYNIGFSIGFAVIGVLIYDLIHLIRSGS
jgi:predicted ferric reductase